MPKFTKNERLLKSSEFAVVYKEGRRIFGRSFLLSYISGSKRRLGLTVSGKVGPANVRNRIKRVLREFFRLNKELFPVADIIITAKARSAKLLNGEIREEIGNILSRLK